MGDPRYRRTTGGKNAVQRMGYRAKEAPDNAAVLKSGAVFEMRKDGWRRLGTAAVKK